VQQHNLGDVANSISLCVQKLHSHNSERIIKIDPRLTKLCEKHCDIVRLINSHIIIRVQFFDSQCIIHSSFDRTIILSFSQRVHAWLAVDMN